MTGFPPLIGINPKVLILGSMPSQISLSEQQYYGNPNNVFWWIMSEFLGFSLELNYSSRVDGLQKSPFSVWDVLADCERPGSLDSSIVRTSETPNDIASFLFLRHNKEMMSAQSLQRPPPEIVQLPSTSPAYASMNKREKCRIWTEAFNAHL